MLYTQYLKDATSYFMKQGAGPMYSTTISDLKNGFKSAGVL